MVGTLSWEGEVSEKELGFGEALTLTLRILGSVGLSPQLNEIDL